MKTQDNNCNSSLSGSHLACDVYSVFWLYGYISIHDILLCLNPLCRSSFIIRFHFRSHLMILSAIIYGIHFGQCMGEGSDVHTASNGQWKIRYYKGDVCITNIERCITTYWFYFLLLYCMCIIIKYLHTWYVGSLYNVSCPLQKVFWKHSSVKSVAIVNLN